MILWFELDQYQSWRYCCPVLWHSQTTHGPESENETQNGAGLHRALMPVRRQEAKESLEQDRHCSQASTLGCYTPMADGSGPVAPMERVGHNASITEEWSNGN